MFLHPIISEGHSLFFGMNPSFLCAWTGPPANLQLEVCPQMGVKLQAWPRRHGRACCHPLPVAFVACLLETGPVIQLRSLHISQIDCLRWLFESSFVMPGRRFCFRPWIIFEFWGNLKVPVWSGAGILKPSAGDYKRDFWKRNHVSTGYTMAVFCLQTCSFRKFVWLSFAQNGSSSTLQVLVRLFFTARQTGDGNRIKQFVQFLASCMLEIRITPGCT